MPPTLEVNNMKKLILDANRDAYCTSDCGSTMTVSELIELLSEYDGDMKIYLRHDGGFTYGAITSNCFKTSRKD